MCLLMGNVGRGKWVSPRGEPRHWPLASFSEATCFSQGLLGEPRWGQVHGEDTRCMGEGASVCLLMGNVGWEAWVSPSG